MSTTGKEREYWELHARLVKETAVFEVMLNAMGDMTEGCKIGILYSNRTLYVDKPSAFQGIVRWMYSQTRDKVREYFDTEVFNMRNARGSFMILIYELWIASGEIIDYCATPARGVRLSNELRAAYRELCARNMKLLMRVSHGFAIIAQSYAVDDDAFVTSSTLITANYIDTALKRLTTERMRLEYHINKLH